MLPARTSYRPASFLPPRLHQKPVSIPSQSLLSSPMAKQPQTDSSSPLVRQPTTVGMPKPQAPDNSIIQMPPLMLLGIVPVNNPNYNEHGAGIYAIPYFSQMGSPNTFIPLKYNIPARQSSRGASVHGLEVGQQHGLERPVVVRRFHFAFQLDLGLIIKLVAMVFLLSQDGSPQKLILLVFFASVIYLYQTGNLVPFLRWLFGRQRDPQVHIPLRLQNDPPVVHDGQNIHQPGENNGADNLNRNQRHHNQEQPNANGDHPDPERHENILRQVFKEVQAFVFGFLTSLVPGLHDHD